MALSAGSLLALPVVSILVAIFLIVGLKADETHLNDRDVSYASAVAMAALNAKGIANDERGFLMTGDPGSSTKPTSASAMLGQPSRRQ